MSEDDAPDPGETDGATPASTGENPSRPEEGLAVEVEGLTRVYGERKALDGVDLDVERSTIFGLLGPNGGGKSTLFRVLSTLLPPTSGTARVFGHDVVTASAAVRREIGVVFQSPSLDKKLRVAENLRHHGHLYGMRGATLTKRIEEALERFGLADRARDRVETLSGGLARRAEIAKGLLHGPRMLLLDEPSTGLDPAARAGLRDLLADLRRTTGITILLTTHLLEEAEGCDALALIDEGKVVAKGSPASLKAEVGGTILRIATVDAEALVRDLAERLELEAKAANPTTVEMRHPEGHTLVAAIGGEFGDRIESLTVGKPDLEDVFLARTGRRLED